MRRCIICGCSEQEGCLLPDGDVCAWASLDPLVCSAPECLAAARRMGELPRDEPLVQTYSEGDLNALLTMRAGGLG